MTALSRATLVAGSLVAITAVGGGALFVHLSARDTAGVASTAPAAASAATSGANPRKMPTYLPAGAKLVKDVHEPQLDGWLVSYSLPGKANSNTINEVTFAEGIGHPDTLLKIAIVARAEQFYPADPAYFATRTIDVGGVAGQLSVPTSGYGMHSVVWFDGDHAYRVSVHRIRTEDGTSGVSVEELMRVASSMA